MGRIVLTKRKWEVPDPGYVVVPTPPEEWVEKESIKLTPQQWRTLASLVDLLEVEDTGLLTVDVDGESFTVRKE